MRRVLLAAACGGLLALPGCYLLDPATYRVVGRISPAPPTSWAAHRAASAPPPAISSRAGAEPPVEIAGSEIGVRGGEPESHGLESEDPSAHEHGARELGGAADSAREESAHESRPHGAGAHRPETPETRPPGADGIAGSPPPGASSGATGSSRGGHVGQRDPALRAHTVELLPPPQRASERRPPTPVVERIERVESSRLAHWERCLMNDLAVAVRRIDAWADAVDPPAAEFERAVPPVVPVAPARPTELECAYAAARALELLGRIGAGPAVRLEPSSAGEARRAVAAALARIEFELRRAGADRRETARGLEEPGAHEPATLGDLYRAIARLQRRIVDRSGHALRAADLIPRAHAVREMARARLQRRDPAARYRIDARRAETVTWRSALEQVRHLRTRIRGGTAQSPASVPSAIDELAFAVDLTLGLLLADLRDAESPGVAGAVHAEPASRGGLAELQGILAEADLLIAQLCEPEGGVE